jgi:hypothetical protein
MWLHGGSPVRASRISGRRGDRRAISTKPNLAKTEAMPTNPSPQTSGRPDSWAQTSSAEAPWAIAKSIAAAARAPVSPRFAVARSYMETGNGVAARLLFERTRNRRGVEMVDARARSDGPDRGPCWPPWSLWARLGRAKAFWRSHGLSTSIYIRVLPFVRRAASVSNPRVARGCGTPFSRRRQNSIAHRASHPEGGEAQRSTPPLGRVDRPSTMLRFVARGPGDFPPLK